MPLVHDCYFLLRDHPVNSFETYRSATAATFVVHACNSRCLSSIQGHVHVSKQEHSSSMLRVGHAGPVQLGLASLGSAIAQWLLLSGAMAQAGFPIAIRWGGKAAGELFRQLLGTASPVLLTTCALHGASWTDLAVASYIPGTNFFILPFYDRPLPVFPVLANRSLSPQ